jgi:L-amino acid N-acyltransferase YncA
MIRNATIEDIPAIAAIGAHFHAVAGWSDIAGYSADDCAKSIAAMMEAGSGLFVVADEDGEIAGMAGGVVFPLYFNSQHLSGQELFLWVEEQQRDGLGGNLLAALEDEARKAGCDSWSMIALDKVRPAATGALYKRRGYRAAEHSWMKRL